MIFLFFDDQYLQCVKRYQSLLRDYFVEDIECNGIGTPVYIVHRIYRNIKTNLIFRDIDNLVSFVEKLAQKCGKYISEPKYALQLNLIKSFNC